ncbi:hypothetical protein MPDQ_005955 [Monascus purpureus]|uniref:Uncharacterized protein n=1 Tax=Monascus purpureus TaxID=5098 RepID=A0A507QZ17_MONPU|nr:hypothetical protein MPDQ_005955 [Monascus purpureus]BDD64071.1 hypothetical protein MAP00_008917 [Monascus purpureus]
MQFKSIAISLFLAVASVTASDNSAISYLSEIGITGVTNGPTATKLAHALQSVYSSWEDDKSVKSAYSVMQTAVPDKVWHSIASSGIRDFTTTNPPSWFTGLPKDVKKEVSRELSILESVETSVLKIKTNAAPEPTPAIALGGAAVAGVLGVVAVL